MLSREIIKLLLTHGKCQNTVSITLLIILIYSIIHLPIFPDLAMPSPCHNFRGGQEIAVVSSHLAIIAEMVKESLR